MSETYYARLAALASAPAATPADQLPKLRQLLEKVLRDECKRREAPFADLSQAIGLVAYDHNLPPLLRRQLQNLRLVANLVLHESYPGKAAEVATGFMAVAELVRHLSGAAYAGPLPAGAVASAEEQAIALLEAEAPVPAASPVWRVQVLHADLGTGQLTAELCVPADNRPSGPFTIDLPAAYDNLLPLAAALHPVLHLVNPVAQPNGHIRPRRVVLEPDYLVSVTTIAECAQAGGTLPDWALLKAFQPDETSRPLVVGNLVNMLLDEEVSHAARQEEWASLPPAAVLAEVDEATGKIEFAEEPASRATEFDLEGFF